MIFGQNIWVIKYKAVIILLKKEIQKLQIKQAYNKVQIKFLKMKIF